MQDYAQINRLYCMYMMNTWKKFQHPHPNNASNHFIFYTCREQAASARPQAISYWSRWWSYKTNKAVIPIYTCVKIRLLIKNCILALFKHLIMDDCKSILWPWELIKTVKLFNLVALMKMWKITACDPKFVFSLYL